jgi:DNA-binding CsgD family transcriptional regulator
VTSGVPEFTAVERRVLLLLADGWTNNEIQGSMGLPGHALARVLQSLYRKTGIRLPGEP